MKLSLTFFVFVFLSTYSSGLSDRISKEPKEPSLEAFAWQSQQGRFPQQSDFPEVSTLSSRRNTAIGFSGGGIRAYTAALGQLRALWELGLLQNTRYVGGVSGGAWATLVSIYAQNITDYGVLLGEISKPEDLTLSRLSEMSAQVTLPAYHTTTLSYKRVLIHSHTPTLFLLLHKHIKLFLIQCARSFVQRDIARGMLGYLEGGKGEPLLSPFFHPLSTISKLIPLLPTGVPEAWTNTIHDMFLAPVGISRQTRFSWYIHTSTISHYYNNPCSQFL